MFQLDRQFFKFNFAFFQVINRLLKFSNLIELVVYTRKSSLIPIVELYNIKEKVIDVAALFFIDLIACHSCTSTHLVNCESWNCICTKMNVVSTLKFLKIVDHSRIHLPHSVDDHKHPNLIRADVLLQNNAGNILSDSGNG
jgi:hypothetical protein